ncbi:MAG TPA: hypothetical protein DCQ31_05170 [Bacteroidales bacterium]|nr:hypothetical protein [Bacteroidales bacterium]
MYPLVLQTHSILRWVVLIALLYVIIKAFVGWFAGKQYTKLDGKISFLAVSLTHVQLLFGATLFFISPKIDYFLNNFKTAVKESDIRFLAMEHTALMLIAVVLITVGSALVKRKQTDKAKFKTAAIWFSIGLLIILASIPWSAN